MRAVIVSFAVWGFSLQAAPVPETAVFSAFRQVDAGLSHFVQLQRTGVTGELDLVIAMGSACDTLSEKKAFRLRSYSIDTAPHWIALRFAKLIAHWGRGLLRRLNAMPAPAAGGIHDETQEATSPWVRSTPAHE